MLWANVTRNVAKNPHMKCGPIPERPCEKPRNIVMMKHTIDRNEVVSSANTMASKFYH